MFDSGHEAKIALIDHLQQTEHFAQQFEIESSLNFQPIGHSNLSKWTLCPPSKSKNYHFIDIKITWYEGLIDQNSPLSTLI
jgi:hypothetical protein